MKTEASQFIRYIPVCLGETKAIFLSHYLINLN